MEKIEKKRKKEQEKLEKAEAKPKTKRPRKNAGPNKKQPSKEVEAEEKEVDAGAKGAEAEPNKRRRSKSASVDLAKDPKVVGDKALPKSKAGAKKGKGKHVVEDPAGASAEPAEELADKTHKPDKEDLKAKRRDKAAQSLGLLCQLKIPDLYMPAGTDLGERISYTAVDPNKEGSSIYVVLASNNFFVTKTVDKSLWPEACSHLKVHHACLKVHLCKSKKCTFTHKKSGISCKNTYINIYSCVLTPTSCNFGCLCVPWPGREDWYHSALGRVRSCCMG